MGDKQGVLFSFAFHISDSLAAVMPVGIRKASEEFNNEVIIQRGIVHCCLLIQSFVEYLRWAATL